MATRDNGHYDQQRVQLENVTISAYVHALAASQARIAAKLNGTTVAEEYELIMKDVDAWMEKLNSKLYITPGRR
jgi:sulfur carrier protein ThiS